MGNKLPALDFAKLFDDYGEEAALQTKKDVEEGKISIETLQKYLYDEDETREEYSKRLKSEYADWE